jgi:HAD superfamily hydrolase (TIGR01509 family)
MSAGAFLFDLDGTLADTEPLWMAAKSAVALRHGVPWTADDARTSIGQPTPVYSAEFVARGAPVDAEVIADQITALVAAAVGGGVAWRPGALALLRDAAQAGVRIGLVTMAYRPVAEAVARATGVAFDTIVAGDDVVHSKPHPEPYLRALARLGLHAHEAIAVEDTATGADSAAAAGLRTLVVPSAAPVPASPDRGFAPTLEGMTAAGVCELLRGA